MDVRTFLEEFGHIANAPEGVQCLRDMVYNLAITGDLTRKNIDDGHAQDLINTIALTKDKLIKDKSFKRSPKLEKIPLTIPKIITIPDNWVWTQLVRIGEINPKNDVGNKAEASFIPMSGISQFHLGDIDSEERQWSKIKTGYTHFADGDVVVAKITPCYENRKSAIIHGLKNGVGAGTTELHVVRLIKDLVEPAYVYIFLRSPYFIIEGEKNMTGTAGQKRLPTEYFATRAFPLPPLEEQKRIVAKVDELMALCNRLEAQQQKRSELAKLTRTAVLDALANAQSPNELKVAWKRVQKNMGLLFERPEDVGELRNVISQLAVEGYLTNTKEEISRWKISKLKDCAKDLFTGPFGTALHKKDYIDNGTPVINPSNIHTGKILPNRSVTVDKKTLKRLSKYQVIENDIIVGRRGEMGRCAVVKPNQSGWLCGTGSMLIRPNRLVFPDFLAAVIRSPRGKLQLSDNSVGITMSNLNQKALTNLSFLLPPYEVQEDIIKRYGEFTTVCDILESQLTKARSIAEKLAQSAVAAITGTQIEDKEKMKAPKTELVTKLRLRKSPSTKEQAPLCTILGKHNSELSAKALWNYSGLAIDDFYCQLKTEMTNGWIDEPQKAEMKIVEEKEPVK